MREPISGTLCTLVRHEGRDFRAMTPVVLEPALIAGMLVPAGRLIVCAGWHRWQDGAIRHVGAVTMGASGNLTDWGLYFQRHGNLYLLAHKTRLNAHSLIDEGLPHLGADLLAYLYRIDTAPAWGQKEEVAAP